MKRSREQILAEAAARGMGSMLMTTDSILLAAILFAIEDAI